MLHTASFYQPQDWHGRLFRVSRQHPRGRRVQWESLPFFYPTYDIIKAYRKGEIDFERYTRDYLGQLEERWDSDSDMRSGVRASPGLGDFTLLCFERVGEPCHRLILARWLKDQQPDLLIGPLN
ncbi:MAG: DUF488 domain-containing protein [SAR202 cluster bacterium]|nr:DUF488 domain-containing protein [SAR202 cluster bacterium]